MSEKTENAPVAKKSRGKLWLIIGAGIVLIIVYQSGRSSGTRSALESAYPVTNVITPVDSTGQIPMVPPTAASVRPAASPSPGTAVPVVRHQRIPLEPSTDHVGSENRAAPIRPTAMTIPSPDNSSARIAIPANSPVDTSLRPPNRVLETGPPPLLPAVIGQVDPRQVPTAAPANSIYDRPAGATIFQGGQNSGQVAARPSQAGVMPLDPLPTLPATPAGTPQTFRQPTVAPQLAPLVRVQSISTCDCGVAH